MLLKKLKQKVSNQSIDSLTPKKKESESFIEKEIIDDTQITFNEFYESKIKEIEKKTKLDRKILYLLVIITLISFVVGKYEILFSNILTMIFPIKWTMEEYQKYDEDFIKMWGTFWIIFGICVIFDIFHRIVLYFVPFYFLIRTISLLYLYLPCFKGAITVYNVVFVEVFKYTSLKKRLDAEGDNSLLSELKKIIKAKKE